MHVFVLSTGMNSLYVLAYPKNGKTQGFGAGSIASGNQKGGSIGDTVTI